MKSQLFTKHLEIEPQTQAVLYDAIDRIIDLVSIRNKFPVNDTVRNAFDIVISSLLLETRSAINLALDPPKDNYSEDQEIPF